MERKIQRKVTIDIYQKCFHTQTQESALYKTDWNGNSISDPFKNIKTMTDLRSFFLLEPKGREYLEKCFNTGSPEYDADFVLVKINKRNLSQKQYISKYEFLTSKVGA